MRPLILITNDDGVLSPGIKAAAEAVFEIGDVIIVAPRFQQTSMSRSFPKVENMGVIENIPLIIDGKEIIAYGVTGSPALAVSHGILELCGRKPDLCISGINYGENLGLSVFPSGTVGAALEANTYGIPSLAVNKEIDISLHHSSEFESFNWDTAKYFTKIFALQILKEGLPEKVALYNINVPHSATIETEVRFTRQSSQNHIVFKKPEKRDFSKPYKLGIEIEIDFKTLEKNSDIHAIVVDKVISVTPLSWDMSI